VILGACLVLFAIGFNLRFAIQQMGEKFLAFLAALGVFIYAATGALSLFFNTHYLDYSALAPLLNTDPVSARSFGILIVEIGVGMAVMAVMIMLYYTLSSAGRHDEGL
jgi:multicomponent Na+:H+ antiporter subunit B